MLAHLLSGWHDVFSQSWFFTTIVVRAGFQVCTCGIITRPSCMIAPKKLTTTCRGLSAFAPFYRRLIFPAISLTTRPARYAPGVDWRLQTKGKIPSVHYPRKQTLSDSPDFSFPPLFHSIQGELITLFFCDEFDLWGTFILFLKVSSFEFEEMFITCWTSDSQIKLNIQISDWCHIFFCHFPLWKLLLFQQKQYFSIMHTYKKNTFTFLDLDSLWSYFYSPNFLYLDIFTKLIYSFFAFKDDKCFLIRFCLRSVLVWTCKTSYIILYYTNVDFLLYFQDENAKTIWGHEMDLILYHILILFELSFVFKGNKTWWILLEFW